MAYITYLDVNGVRGDIPVTQVGSGAPTTSTVGAVGQFYMDKSTNDYTLYKCVNVSNGVYTWTKISTNSSGGNSPIALIENTDSSNKIPLRGLASGTYVLKGYFTSYAGSSESYTFSTGMLVSVVYLSSMSYIQIFYPKNNTIQYLEISDNSATRQDAKLINMESTANMVTTVNSNSDNSHYPSAKAVYDAIEALRTELQGS